MTKLENCIDLHTHSYCSDGTFSPEGLVILAKKAGLQAIALTDHDTVDGLAQFMEAGKTHKIETISGIELAAHSDMFHKPELHMVGLGIDINSQSLKNCMDNIQKSRIARNEKMIACLNSIDLTITLHDVEACAGGEVITRAHFAKALLQKGYVSTMNEAFLRFISPGLPGYVERELFSPSECIEMIHEAGGVAILAHPTLYNLDFDQLDTLCASLKSNGLDGIECFYSSYTKEQRKKIAKLARKHQLLPSGGSDFHGENKPDIRLGFGMGSLAIPYGVWEDLSKQLEEYS